jgi:hypothetical protein
MEIPPAGVKRTGQAMGVYLEIVPRRRVGQEFGHAVAIGACRVNRAGARNATGPGVGARAGKGRLICGRIGGGQLVAGGADVLGVAGAPPVEPDEPGVDVELPLTVGAVVPDVEVEPEPPLEPEVGVGTTVTGTVTCCPVVVSTSVRVVEPLPDVLVTGNNATVEVPSAASADGSVTTSMSPDRLGPVEG